jgi:hypothetical protein
MISVDPSTIVPNFIVGSIAVAIGTLVVIFRRHIRDYTIRFEKNVVGKNATEELAKLQTPFWVGVAGMGGVGIGLTMLAFATVGTLQL